MQEGTRGLKSGLSLLSFHAEPIGDGREVNLVAGSRDRPSDLSVQFW